MKKTLLIFSLISFSIVNAQIQNGMVAHFPFNGDYTDISSSAIVVTNSGSSFGNDHLSMPNQAIEMNGNDYISFNNAATKPSLPLTISAWVKVNNTTGDNVIIASDQVYGNYYGYWFHVIASGKVAIDFSGGLGGSSSNNRRSFSTDTELTPGVWYHLVGVIRSYNNMSIYIDCEEQTGFYTGTGATNMVYSSTESRIGNAFKQNIQPEGAFLDGSLDELIIWNRALSPTEITSLCDKRNPLSVLENDLEKAPRELIKIVNVLGQEVKATPNTPLIYIYSDGSTEKVVIIE